MSFNQAYSNLLARLPASLIDGYALHNSLSEIEAGEINQWWKHTKLGPTLLSFKELCIYVSDKEIQTQDSSTHLQSWRRKQSPGYEWN
jgi:hypothetical protein